ncbi:MAG: aldo/keto reductase [Acidobacteriota bacterium]|nr:aldo/keto reductase [Acidobacteriota bacterium]
MIYRALGRTGVQVSALGLGGFHLGCPQLSSAEAVRLVRTALDGGLTFMDNSWDYREGESEKRLGKALREGNRSRAFVMTKVDGRTKKEAARQLDESLARLRVDVIDLLQHHEVIRYDDVDRIFAEGGAMEAFLAARKAGKIRFIGFTGHKDPGVHLYMLATAKRHGFRFDTVQMPLNLMDTHFRSFEKQVLPELVAARIGVLSMKSMGNGVILKSGAVTAVECLHYALNLPTSVVITGIDSMKILKQALKAAETFQPLTKPEEARLRAKTAQLAVDGAYELFKTTSVFDSTAAHPEWLGEEPARTVRLAGL